MWERIKKIFAASSPHRHLPRPRTVLDAALKHNAGVSLFFVDRQRQLENVICYIQSVEKNRIVLKSRKNFLPDILNNEKCSIYFKLPYEVIVNDLKLPPASARLGFLCKSRIISNSLNKETRACEIEIAMPLLYIQRELRRHERVYPSRSIVKAVELWLPPSRLPENERQLGEADFSCREENAQQLGLVNISAGGARVQIDQVEFLDEFNNMDGKDLLLRITLLKLGNKQFSVLALCRCVESAYSIILQRLSLRLQFLKVRQFSEGDLGYVWIPVSLSGVPEILDWVNNEFSFLMEQPG